VNYYLDSAKIEIATASSVSDSRRRKKEKWGFGAKTYKQATPTGFAKRVRNRNLSSALKDVRNDKGREAQATM